MASKRVKSVGSSLVFGVDEDEDEEEEDTVDGFSGLNEFEGGQRMKTVKDEREERK